MKEPLIPQTSFRFRNHDDKKAFRRALTQQPHVSSATFFFQSCCDALVEASKNGKIIEWPVKFRQRKKSV